ASPESFRRTRRPSSGWGRTGIGDVNVWVMSVLPRWVLGDDTGAAPHRWCGAAGRWRRSRGARAGEDRRARSAMGQLPTGRRRNAVTVPPASSTTWPTDFLLSLANAWSRRQFSLK